MKSIFQMELEDKFNRKIKYREKKIETQRKVIGKQREQIFQLREQLQHKDTIINELLEFIKDMFDDEAISNSFDMTKKEFVKLLESEVIKSD